MTKEELILHIQEAMKTEESAIAIYSRHLSAISRRSGLPNETLSRIQKTLDTLIRANQEHKNLLTTLLRRIQGESIDVY